MTDIESLSVEVAGKLHQKVWQLYAFLKEANQVQFRPLRRLSEQQYVIRIADMPKHPSAQLFRPIKIEGSLEVPDTLIRVSRPKLTRCPSPPESCVDWLLPSWDDPALNPAVAENKNIQKVEADEEGNEIEVTKTILFIDDQLRVDSYRHWLDIRKKWVDPELVEMIDILKGKKGARSRLNLSNGNLQN